MYLFSSCFTEKTTECGKNMKFHKKNLGNIVHNLFSLIDLLYSCSGESLLITKGRVYSLISNGPVVVDDDDNDTSMATMIRHLLLLPILIRKKITMGVRNKKGNGRKREYFSSILHRDRYILCDIVYTIFELKKKKMLKKMTSQIIQVVIVLSLDRNDATSIILHILNEIHCHHCLPCCNYHCYCCLFMLWSFSL